jgi:hypothetical protein
MEGFYSTGAANSKCLKCPAGSITSGNTSASFDNISKCVSCIAGTRAPTRLKPNNIRLKGGLTNHEGRVEIYNPNTKEWGTITSSYWKNANAMVVCKQLGLGTVVSFSTNSKYGSSFSSQFAGVSCNGGEQSIFDCPSVWGSVWDTYRSMGSSRSDDVGVICTRDALLCELCESGYSDSPGSQTCKSCPLGYVASGFMPSDHDSIDDCRPCGPGTFANTILNTCDTCIGSTYSMNIANPNCVSCPSGFVIKEAIDDDDENDIALNHNDFFDCQPCDAGTYESGGK